MDALAKLNEHFLSCNICTETYKDPCTLGCYHTFCRECLTKYTKTRRDAITAKSIMCPNCCQMTKVPRPQEQVDQWCAQFKPSFLIQGLLDSFVSQESSEKFKTPKTSTNYNSGTESSESKHLSLLNPSHFCIQLNTVVSYVNITVKEHRPTQCVKIATSCYVTPVLKHVVAPNGRDHVITPLGAGSTPKIKKRKVMCQEHNCLVEFCCRDCQKAVCLIPEMKQVLQQNYDDIESHRQQTGNTLKSKRSEVGEITQHKFSLQSEIRRVSQQAVDLIRRKEKKLLDELDTLTEKQTGELRGQIKSGEIDLQTYQQYTEFIKQVLQSNSLMDLYDTYTLCQSVDLTAVMQRKDKQGERMKKVEFEDQVDMDEFERMMKFGRLKLIENKSQLEDTPKPLPAVSAKSKEDFTVAVLHDIEVLNVDGTDTLVVVDFNNKSIKSSYTKDKKQLCTSLKLNQQPFSLTKISQDRVAVSYYSHNSIELIKLTPDPVRITTIETKKKYEYLTALSDTTLAAGCRDPPSIDVLDLSGRILRSVITPSTGQQLIQSPRYMCTTRQGHIVMSDGGSGSVYCVTQQGEVLYTYQLTGRYWTGGVTTTDTGSVIVANNYGNKIVQLTERGEYVRDLLTGRDGIVEPLGIRVHGNKLYVTEYINDHIKLFQL